MTCHSCTASCNRFGRTRAGSQRYRCRRCRKTFCEPRRTVGNHYTSFDKTCAVAHCLVEGNSVRSTARLTGVEVKTVLSLLAAIGRDCADLLTTRVRKVDISHLELDEVWAFVYKKQKHVTADDPDPDHVGDAYTYIALDRKTKLVAAWHLGKRDEHNTLLFVRKIRKATSKKRFQVSSDGWSAYEWALEIGMSDRVSYGRIVKVTYPGRVEAVFGNPDIDEIETTFVERINGTLRQWCKRYTRKTYAFSKRWSMLEAALALNIAHYNFCRIHRTLRVTPAMEAGLTDHVWSLRELLEKACL